MPRYHNVIKYVDARQYVGTAEEKQDVIDWATERNAHIEYYNEIPHIMGGLGLQPISNGDWLALVAPGTFQLINQFAMPQLYDLTDPGEELPPPEPPVEEAAAPDGELEA